MNLANLIERKILDSPEGRDAEWLGVILRDTREMNEHATIKEFEHVMARTVADLVERRAKVERSMAQAVIAGEATDLLKRQHIECEAQVSALNAVRPIFKTLQTKAEMRLRELTQES